MELQMRLNSEMRIRLIQIQLTQDIMAHKTIGILPYLHYYQINVDKRKDDQPYIQELHCYAELYKYGNTELRKAIFEHTKDYHNSTLIWMFSKIVDECPDLEIHLELARCEHLYENAVVCLIDCTPHKEVVEFFRDGKRENFRNGTKASYIPYALERLEKDFGDT